MCDIFFNFYEIKVPIYIDLTLIIHNILRPFQISCLDTSIRGQSKKVIKRGTQQITKSTLSGSLYIVEPISEVSVI